MSSPLVIVGMSGGVDSSVAAWLLQQQGYDVQGLFMSNWDEDEDGYCTAAQDYQDARQVCEQLGIPLHKVSFAGEYRERVFAYFLEEYRAGRTPNPDVLCNREIKFGVCFDYARRLGAEWVATGHYARVEHDARPRLLKGVDPTKDQSYFLHAMPAQALARTLFPIGDLQKDDVRADRARPDAAGVRQEGQHRHLLHRRAAVRRVPGALPAGAAGRHRNARRPRLGQHHGLMYYTLGQRQGLRIGGRSDRRRAPWYVADKDLARNVLIVVQGHDHPALLRDRLMRIAVGVGRRRARRPARFECTAKVRYRQADQPCEVRSAGRRTLRGRVRRRRSAPSRRGNMSCSMQARSAWAAASSTSGRAASSLRRSSTAAHSTTIRPACYVFRCR